MRDWPMGQLVRTHLHMWFGLPLLSRAACDMHTNTPIGRSYRAVEAPSHQRGLLVIRTTCLGRPGQQHCGTSLDERRSTPPPAVCKPRVAGFISTTEQSRSISRCHTLKLCALLAWSLDLKLILQYKPLLPPASLHATMSKP
jgi:hypothetical protein